MKKTLNSFLIVLILTGIAQTAIAQKSKFSEGKIIYDITYPGTELDENTMAMMPSDATLYVKKDMSRMEMKMGGMGTAITISNGKDGSSVTLMDMMGNKTAMKMSKDDIKKEKDNHGKPDVKITDETKDIAGYKCTKAIVTMNGKDKQTFNVWFTKDIEAHVTSRNHIEGIDGFLMEFQIQQQGMNIKLTSRSVEAQPVDDAMFKIPEGYKEMTRDDMKNMQEGMGK